MGQRQTASFTRLALKSRPTIQCCYASGGPTPTSGIVPFKLADVGEGIAECEVLKWHVKEGDTIKEFDPLCEVQSDKATVEITSRFDGVVVKLHHKKGDMAKVGAPLVDIDLGGKPGETSAAPEHLPKTITEQAGPVLAAAVAAANAPTPSVEFSNPNAKSLATPSVRHLSKSKNIDLTKVQGTGRDGRILKEDIIAFELLKNQPQATVKPVVVPHTPIPETKEVPASASLSASQKPREQKLPLSGIKRVMARTMTAAVQIPHFGYCDEFAMDGLQVLRAQLKPIAESQGVKMTYMPFFIKAASLALIRYPTLNSSLNTDMTEITIKNYHNIGVAMDTPQGLLVPNIKDVQDKSLIDIARELQRLHHAAVNNQLTPADMTGGTFTLSNIGTIGGTYASPVLVIPEVAIGAIGKIQKVPKYDSKGNIVPVHLLQVSWSADHRVIDGATMAHFSNLMKLYVEKPETMLSMLR